MRIALVTDTYLPQVNGVTTVTRRIVRTLLARGTPPAVVAPRYPGGGPPAPEELRIPSVPFPPYPAIRLSLPFTARIHAFLDQFRPELLHVVSEGPLGLIGRRYAVRHGLPLVTSYHTDFPGYCRHYGAGALEGAVWRWLVWFHSAAGLIHTPGTSVRDELVRRGLTRATVWGRGVDCERFDPGRDRGRWRRRLELPDDVALVLHVGRLAPEKNADTLVRAWTTARDALGGRACFVIAGDGPLAGLIEARLPWVRRIGFLDRNDLADLYAAADLCVLPSATETCGLVALEAMASGVPVIAADAGGLRETVEHGVNGLLASPDNPSAFSAHIVRLAMELPLRRAMAAAARTFALTRDAHHECDEVIQHYAALIAGRAWNAQPSPSSEDAECAA